MSASRLADLRVRASASQVVGLDVRGPVSQALARAGVAVPPAPLAEHAAEAQSTPPVPTAPASPAGARPATRVLKPFADAPWPTQKPKAAPEAVVTLSGLTADERRVHRILLDTLARVNTLDDVSDGLTYVEKKRLGTLDLEFIDAEIAQMQRRPATLAVPWIVLAVVLGVGVPLLLAADAGGGVGDKLFSVIAGAICALAFVLNLRKPGRNSQRLAIYQALRELALLVDDAPVSDALAQADAVIDRLATADEPAPRLSLDRDSFTPTTSASRPRTRS